MTAKQTRQLGIEFERRIQTLFPNTILNEKLDTDTIYSFLNEYLYIYVRDLYLLLDSVESNTQRSKKISETLKPLVKREQINPSDRNVDNDGYNTTFDLPEDYFLYIRSTSMLSKTYKSENELEIPQRAANIVLNESDVNSTISSFYDQNKIIRTPIVLLESGSHIKVIHDKYSKLSGLDLTYIHRPRRFNVIGFDNSDLSANAVRSYCELPYNCFEELVSGAIQLYVTYKAGRQQPSKKQNEQEDNQ